MATKTESIKKFLEVQTKKDLASLYSLSMECQVNVAQDGGDRVDGEFHGKRWHGWSDGIKIWKSFRIPYKANTEPEYEDSELKFNLEEHAEGIGMTGWDWVNKVSRWVAFDFDAITGHSHKHSKKIEDLESVHKAAAEIDWVTIRRSTSGKGLHLYVFLNEVPTANHTEHAALARSILGMLSALTGFDFVSRVDICGGNMWVWHRKMKGTNGLELIKEGSVLEEIPANWQDHIKVISGKRYKNLPQAIEDSKQEDLFEQLCGQRLRVPLDDEHKKLIAYLKDNNALWWWDQDNHMLVTHTSHLKDAYESLKLKGFFNTLSTGKEKGHDHNCFLYPIRGGGWSVRRYTLGVQEHESWSQDGAGWTWCYYNRDPDLATACKAFGGVEDPKGGFIFREAEVAQKAALLLRTTVNLPPEMLSRPAKLKQHKDGRLLVELEHNPYDKPENMTGWFPEKNKWVRMYNTTLIASSESELGNFDDLVRHIVTEQDEDYGWSIKSEGTWRFEPITHIRTALGSLNLSPKDITNILGSSVFKCWKTVNFPFQPEYPGDRQWNRRAAQFKFTPSQDRDNLKYESWVKILEHCGNGLDYVVSHNPWCKSAGVLTGRDYLKCWIASLFQRPSDPLPYLFFYGDQNCGKSIFHEALSLLVTRGYCRADVAITSTSSFNAELENAIICVLEETDLNKNKAAYNKIKDWVTSKDILIHRKGETPFHIPNTTHWIQCANEPGYCPVFPGDTRITMCAVDNLEPDQLIPKKKFFALLEKEAPDFLAEILNLELPESTDRLGIPVLKTEEKGLAEALNRTPLQDFIVEACDLVPGYVIKFGEFYERFSKSLEPDEIFYWSNKRVGKELPFTIAKGRYRKDNCEWYLGNIKWKDTETVEVKHKLVLKGEGGNTYLEPLI